MGSLTDAAEIDVLKLLTGQATTIFTSTPLAEVWLRLTSTVPTDSSAGTEITDGWYDPVDTKGDWSTPASGAVTNSNDIPIGTASGTPTQIQGAEIWTAATGGTRVLWTELTTPQTPQAGNPVSFPAGSLDMTMT